MEAIVPTEVQVKIAETKVMSDGYVNYAIESAEKYRTAADDVKIIKAKTKELIVLKKSLLDPINESKKRITNLFKEPLDCLERAEKGVKKLMANWHTKQEEIRQAEQKRLDDIQRKEAERLQQAAAKELARAESLKTESAKARAAAKAEELKAKSEIVTEIAPVVENKVEKIDGISIRKTWKFKIVNINEIPREYMIPDEKYIGQIVRNSKGKKEIPGVKTYSEDVISSRT